MYSTKNTIPQSAIIDSDQDLRWY